MSDDLYDDDILWWSEQQAELLRRVAAGEGVNDQLVEEIESGGARTRCSGGRGVSTEKGQPAQGLIDD